MVADDYYKDGESADKYLKYKERQLNSKKIGAIEVMIVDNSKGILYDF